MATSALLLLLMLLSGASGSVSAADARTTTLPGGGTMQTETFQGVPKWRLLSNLWSEKTVNVSCPGATDFSVFTANTAQQLADAVVRKHTAWCGFNSLLAWDSTDCVVSLSPFRETSVAVVHPARRGHNWSSQGSPSCVFTEEQHFSLRRAAMGLVGFVLFMRAKTLVNSLAFRLGTGTGCFVMLSAVILAFLLYRSLPNKKSIVAATALFGTTIASVTRFFLGHWLPSLHDVIYNKWLAGYMAISALLGLAVTYYYDDPENQKLNVILQRGLQLGGACLVLFSPSLPEAGVASVVLMAATYALRGRLTTLPFSKLMPLGGGASARGTTATGGRHGRLNMFPSIIARNGRHGWEPNGHSGMAESSWTEISSNVSGSESSEVDSQSRPVQRRHSKVDSETSSQPGSVREATTPSKRSRLPAQKRTQQQRPSVLSAPISPLVQKGMIFNEASGRTIQMNKPTYKRLVNSGYQVDEVLGTLTPPGLVPKSGGSKRRPATSAQTEPVPQGRGPAHGQSPDASVAAPATSAVYVQEAKVRNSK